MRVEFKPSKETTNAVQFKEIIEEGDQPSGVPTIYVAKPVLSNMAIEAGLPSDTKWDDCTLVVALEVKR